MRALVLVALVVAAGPLYPVAAVFAHTGSPIPSAFGTATIDGVKSPGEWSAATPVSVFSGLVGSQLYVMDNAINLYLGLFVPDGTFTPGDQFGVRIDSQHDAVTDLGDDEVSVTGAASFGDSHYTGLYWGYYDADQNGFGAGSAVSGGNFFEISHPLNDGDPQDLFVMPGQTIGLCVRYSNDSGGSSLDVYPSGCLYGGASEAGYVDYVVSHGQVGVGDRLLSGGARIALRPNPVRRGGDLELRFAIPARGAAVRAGIYGVSGKELARLVDGPYPAGAQSVRWTVPVKGDGALSPGVYFVRVWIGDDQARATLVIVQ
jgi:hypothetical protein